MASKRTKAGRRERFRLHAQGYPRRTPRWARISAEVVLSPVAWARFCELANVDVDSEGNAQMRDEEGW